MFGVDDRILIYPVDRESLPIVKSAANYSAVPIFQLISPESWGYGEEKYQYSDRTVAVSHKYEEGLNDCSVLWVVDSWNDLDFNEYIKPAIRMASQKGKHVVCSKKLSEEEKMALADIEITFIENLQTKPTISRNDRVQEIRTPIIYVLSSTEFCNQFYIETALCSELRERGYDTLLISSRKEGIAFGEYAIPAFMFCSDYSENEKVVAMNFYVRHLEMKHQPEVIIIGVPGAAAPYDRRYSSDFGIIAYEMSEAAKPDFTILSSPCTLSDVSFFEGADKELQGRLGVAVDAHSFAPYALDIADSSNDKSLGYLSVDDYYIEETIKRAGYRNLFNLNNMQGISAVIDRVVDKFTGGVGLLIT
jgi:peptide maturation system protein (TIGR04066 family)